MSDASIKRNGKTYLPVAELAQELGYAIDHVSRLCRQGRVDAIQEENGYWYATRESFLGYRNFAGRIKRRIALKNLGLGEQGLPPVLSTRSFPSADRQGERIRYEIPFRLSPKLVWQEFIFQARKAHWASRVYLRPVALTLAEGFKTGFRYALLALFLTRKKLRAAARRWMGAAVFC